MKRGENVSDMVCVLTRIAECLERIEKALPGGNQEALERDLISLLTSEHTHAEYK